MEEKTKTVNALLDAIASESNHEAIVSKADRIRQALEAINVNSLPEDLVLRSALTIWNLAVSRIQSSHAQANAQGRLFRFQ